MVDNTAARLALTICVPVLLALCLYVYTVLCRPTSKLPGPWYSKWTNLMLDYHWLNGTRPQYVHLLHHIYGPIVRIGPDEVDVCDIDAVKTIYTTRETFLKSAWYQSFTTYGKESVFSTRNVAFHRKHRKLLSGPLGESALQVHTQHIHSLVELAIEKIRQEMRAKGAADIYKWWLFLVTDVIGDLTFGESFRMVELGEKNDYIRVLEATQSQWVIRSRFPLLTSIAHVVPLPFFSQAVGLTRKLECYASESLGRYKRLVDSDPDHVRQTLFTNLFKAKEDEHLTFEEIRDEAEVYIIAGSNSTAVTLSYLVWSVCRHPRVQAALVRELRTLPDDFNELQLKELPYLNQVITETLRLNAPALDGLPRSVPPGGTELCNYHLNEGTTVCVQAYSMHRIPDVYTNPEEFDPSRWEEPTKAMKDAYIAWGRGARGCFGIHVAQLEIRIATARFFLAFPDAKVSGLDGMNDGDMAQEIYWLVSPKGKRCLIQSSGATLG
ncbi:hypothetical protein HIM_11070 [Hirsutella minnesotensis 3608]|uniref:Cytochrome P450 n=1 Tax=Hirsutella minnesotensis 3608 TaxID=1043627 RepID=A0A0F7ZRF6_9HYPO|nr:hypothetical protein HIM_11070 [Hirsutella minnesotensis 3608]